MTQVASGVTISLTFRKSLIACYQQIVLTLSQNGFLESGILILEVLIKQYSFNHKGN